MKSVLLIGLGRFGRHMAAKLQELHHEVLAVDKNEERVNDALDLVTHAQIGDSTSEAFIASLGVRQRHNINILAAKRGEELIPIPGGDYCFREGETMLVLGADRDVQKFLHF